MKQTIEIEDTLEENVESACDDVKTLLREYAEENPEEDEAPDLGDLDYNGAVHEIVDSAVPIYTSEINDTWYLYHSQLEEAYEDAGVGGDSRDNDGMAAIYYYIEKKVHQWYDENAQLIVDGVRGGEECDS